MSEEISASSASFVGAAALVRSLWRPDPAVWAAVPDLDDETVQALAAIAAQCVANGTWALKAVAGWSTDAVTRADLDGYLDSIVASVTRAGHVPAFDQLVDTGA